MRLFPVLLAAALLCGVAASAATYYVDFDGGNNAADGLTPSTAWKHSPGDPNATGRPSAVTLAPGDTVIFRGGVAYRGTIRLTVSGAPNLPITLDGNSAGAFGQGRAVIDGGTIIQHWQPVASPAEVGGNPQWSDMIYADIDLDITPNVAHDEVVLHRNASRDRQAPWQRVILTDGDRSLLPIAQLPKPSDPFYPDLPRDFFLTPHALQVNAGEDVTVLTDPENLAGRTPDFFDGMMLGVHGGNNHVYFARIRHFDPETNQLFFARFQHSIYPQTRYALYNSARLIEQPGEWSIRPLGDGRSRVYLLADRLGNGPPANIGYPEMETAVTIAGGASHIRVNGFLIQRFSGGQGGITVARNQPRSEHITVTDCEIRFLSGHAGISAHHADHITIERCYIHHCSGWTTGIFLNRVNHYAVRNSRLVKNSGSGIRHYECTQGVLRDNVVLDHFGMHSSGINLYEGCADILIEGNYVQNTVAINRNAERFVFRNNVIDGAGRAAVAVGIWTSGTVGGREVRDLHFINNTFVNTNRDVAWATGILAQQRDSPGAPQGLIIRNNILDGLAEDISGTIENNIYTRPVQSRFMGPGCQVIEDPDVLFRDPAGSDFRRRPGGPAMDVGADVPPPDADPDSDPPPVPPSGERLPVVAVWASAHDGNEPANTLDGDLGTRWSAEGAGQWIAFDLGEAVWIEAVEIAFFRGNERVAAFDVQVSADGSDWATALAGATSGGVSLEPERFAFAPVTTRYLRYVGYGNTMNAWNSLTEVRIFGAAPKPPVANEGLVAYYPLIEGGGGVAADFSGSGLGPALLLEGGAQWLEGRGGVRLDGAAARLQSEGAAAALNARLVATGRFTVEVWCAPDPLDQQGPARLVSLSAGTGERNLTLGHGQHNAPGPALVVRLRAPETDGNGMPERVFEGAFTGGLRHYAITHDGATLRAYRDGALLGAVAAQAPAGWADAFALVLGSETGGERGWAGEMHRVAIHDRALEAAELARHAVAGGLLTAGGTPHAWLEAHRLLAGGLGHEEADATDHDRDGHTAAEEYVAGTDPNDPTSRLAMRAEAEPGAVRLQWNGVAGRLYHVLRAPSLVDADWETVHTVAPAADGPLSFTDALDEARNHFYRVTARRQ